MEFRWFEYEQCTQMRKSMYDPSDYKCETVRVLQYRNEEWEDWTDVPTIYSDVIEYIDKD